jgi:hypothetical protein
MVYHNNLHIGLSVEVTPIAILERNLMVVGEVFLRISVKGEQ